MPQQRKEINMTSPSKAQTKANRQNAKRSTGPTSIQGKLKVSQNAITHGIFAASPLLPNENAEEFKKLSQGIAEVFPPVDAAAASIVERIILAIWRQKRLRIAEAAKLQISMAPEIMAEEISDALRLSYNKRLNAQNISEEQELAYGHWVKVIEEFKSINIQAAPKNLAQVSIQVPLIFAQLKHDALQAVCTYDVFMKSPDKIITSLEKTKKYAEDFVASNEIKHTAYKIAQQMKLAKLIPDGKSVEFLSKYQVQLDTDFYRAVDAFKKHMAWRAENLEIEVTEELAA
jgi:hypothetical protein